MDVVYKILLFYTKTLNSGLHLSEWVLPHAGNTEVLYSSAEAAVLHAYEAGWDQPERRVDHLLLVCFILEQMFFPLNVFYLEFYLWGLTFFVAGCKSFHLFVGVFLSIPAAWESYMAPRRSIRVSRGEGFFHREFSLLPIGCLGVIYDSQPQGYTLFYNHLE